MDELRDFIGVKKVKARPMEKDEIPGYEVTYEDGYTSWSPKDVFERAYVDITDNFEDPKAFIPSEMYLWAAGGWRDVERTLAGVPIPKHMVLSYLQDDVMSELLDMPNVEIFNVKHSTASWSCIAKWNNAKYSFNLVDGRWVINKRPVQDNRE